MSKTKSLIRKIITLVLGVLGIGTITSCYGMPPNEDENSFSGTVFAHWFDEETGESLRDPLENVRVSLRSIDRGLLLDIDRTDEEGRYSVYAYSQGENAELVFEPYNSEEDKTRDIQELGRYLETKHIPVKLEYNNYDFHSETINVDLEYVQVNSENNSSSGNEG